MDFSLMAVSWPFSVASSFLWASSVSRAPAAVQGCGIVIKTLQNAY
jgi:hypothetical protein